MSGGHNDNTAKHDASVPPLPSTGDRLVTKRVGFTHTNVQTHGPSALMVRRGYGDSENLFKDLIPGLRHAVAAAKARSIPPGTVPSVICHVLAAKTSGPGSRSTGQLVRQPVGNVRPSSSIGKKRLDVVEVLSPIDQVS
ncbi:MAG: hypothetical protein JWM49_2500 [Microbacteriaceae bacterium]|nr:hypothetical protein [Microbacteriaceae bacterium]